MAHRDNSWFAMGEGKWLIYPAIDPTKEVNL